MKNKKQIIKKNSQKDKKLFQNQKQTQYRNFKTWRIQK